MTCASHSRRPSSRTPIFANCASSFFNWAGASSTCLPVYVIFMVLPSGRYRRPVTHDGPSSFITRLWKADEGLALLRGLSALISNAALVRRGNLHVLAILGDGSPRNVNP